MHEEEYDDNYIELYDDEGNQQLFSVLLTFDSEEFGHSYIVLQPAGIDPNEETEVLAFRIEPSEDPEATMEDLVDIEDPDEWNMVEEVLDAFLADFDVEE